MEEKTLDVPFSYENFDIKYLESLLHDFQKYDKNGDGRLVKKEFVQWLVDGGTKKKVAKRLFYVADSNNDESLSFDEFKHFAQIQHDMIVKNDVKSYAKLIYTSVKSRGKYPNGLTKKEFLKFMKLMNTPVGFFDRRKIFKKYDADKNGTIDFDEIMSKINFKQQKLLCTDD